MMPPELSIDEMIEIIEGCCYPDSDGCGLCAHLNAEIEKLKAKSRKVAPEHRALRSGVLRS